MTALAALQVAVGGALGACLRYLVDLWVRRRLATVLPWGTFVVNVIGSAALGALAGAAMSVPGWVSALVGTGLCGALTTFSTFTMDAVTLWRTGRSPLAVLYVVGTVTAGMLAYLGTSTLTAPGG